MMNMGVEDITHHSKRTQAGNIEKAGTSYDAFVERMSENISGDVAVKVPVNVTIETAIQYFRENATGENTNLFLFTAEILEKYRAISKSTVSKATEESSNDSVLEVNVSKVADND